MEYKDQKLEAQAEGDGGYDAFMNALLKLTKKLGLQLPTLRDYEVRIPPGGKTDALVEAVIVWELSDGTTLRTVGVSPDQVLAAIRATEKMLNRVLQHAGLQAALR